jgi:cell division protein FtsN
VQLSSQPTEGDAASSLRSTQNRLSGLLNGRSLAVRQVDLGAKGTWYRVVLPVDSFQEATQTCASLKANGVDCVPIGG